VKHIKAHTLLGGTLLLVVALALTAGPLAAMALGWESDGSQVDPPKDLDDWKALAEEKGVSWLDATKAVEVVESTHIEVREPSEKQKALVESIRGKPLPPPLVVSQAIRERILEAVDADEADTKIVYLNRADDLYSALVIVTRDGERSFVEVIIKGVQTEVREVQPILIDETSTKEIIIEEFEVENKDPTAPAKIVETTHVRTYELRLTSTSLVTIIACRSQTQRNIFGWLLWQVTARGQFVVHLGQAVLGVIDLSTTTTAWGWYTEWLNSNESLSPVLSTVSATAQFDHPIWPEVTASTRVGVDLHGGVH
jgi:hypothetical protein